jgi:hypothetical protein
MPIAEFSEPIRQAPPRTECVPVNAGSTLLAFPASLLQQVFWRKELLQDEVSAFNLLLHLRLAGPPGVGLLERTLHTTIARQGRCRGASFGVHRST